MACIIIFDDDHSEKPGYFRAFSADSKDDTTVVTLFGYCSPGHSFRTIKETVSDVRRYYPNAEIFRNGKRL